MAKKRNTVIKPELAVGLWLGTEAGWGQYESAIKAATEHQARGGSMEDTGSSLLSVQDGVGTVDISGPLISGSAGWMQMFGITGYSDIADSLIQAVSDPKVSSIVLSINSPGGAVTGVQDLSTLIQNVDKLKPVVSHTGGGMMSAAYWLGVSGRKVYAAQTAEVLSIGTLMVHLEKTKMLDQMGVKATIIRSGEFKALGHPYEPLTDVAKASMQSKADALSGIFLDYVASRRKMSVAVADRTIGQGRTMLAAEALAAGGIDAVGSLSEAAAQARAYAPKSANVRGSLSASVDSPAVASHNPTKPGPKDMDLTEAQLAALASGTPMEEVLLMTAEAAPATETLPVATAPVATSTGETTPVAAAAPAAPAAPADNAAVTYLQGELTKVQASLVQVTAEKMVLEAKATEAKASQDGLLAIARASVRNMSIALGGTAASADALGPTELLAEHARLSEVFTSKFKVGGVAAASATSTPAPKKPVFNPLFTAVAKNVPSH